MNVPDDLPLAPFGRGIKAVVRLLTEVLDDIACPARQPDRDLIGILRLGGGLPVEHGGENTSLAYPALIPVESPGGAPAGTFRGNWVCPGSVPRRRDID